MDDTPTVPRPGTCGVIDACCDKCESCDWLHTIRDIIGDFAIESVAVFLVLFNVAAGHGIRIGSILVDVVIVLRQVMSKKSSDIGWRSMSKSLSYTGLQ